MKKQTYFLAYKQYKNPVEGDIIEHAGRIYGIHKSINEWIVTDIKTGLSMNRGQYKTKKQAIEYTNNIDIDMNAPFVKQAEKEFEELPEYDEHKVYFDTNEVRDNETSYHTGRYKNLVFEITVSCDENINNGMEIDYFKSKNENDFTDDDVEYIANMAIENRCKVV